MSLAQGNNTPTRPRIEPGSPDPESDALTTRPVRPPLYRCVIVKTTIVFFLCLAPGENMSINYLLTVTFSAETSLDLKEVTEI